MTFFHLITARTAHQPFSSLQDFRDRVRPRRRTFEALARVGALDSFIGYDRARRSDLLAHIQSLGGRALPVGPDQLTFDIELPLPDFYRSVTALDLRGRTQTDVELRDLGLAVSHHQ
ncbi:MAG: hypothetical protein H7201_16280, partial [Candidatus Saccharibacteria bacterium]|nr:hypothetical protein [Microbacteriaceae bacterium]